MDPTKLEYDAWIEHVAEQFIRHIDESGRGSTGSLARLSEILADLYKPLCRQMEREANAKLRYAYEEIERLKGLIK